MTAGKAVRVPDELHAALAARVDTHGPITKQVERAIADALEPPSVLEPLLVVEAIEQPARAHAVTSARASRQRPRRTRAELQAEPCRHPINRRIGDGCGACGATSVRERR